MKSIDVALLKSMLLLDHLLVECSFIFVSTGISSVSLASFLGYSLCSFLIACYSVADKRIEPGNEAKSVGNMT